MLQQPGLHVRNARGARRSRDAVVVARAPHTPARAAARRNMNCPVSCGVCGGACKDTHDDCPGWAKEGECSNNPGYTLKMCPFSCGVCEVGESCKDTNSTACAIWEVNDECLKNPDHMHRNCAGSCDVCNTVCENKNADCANWATEGQCEENPGSMLTTCPQSCGVCHDLEKFYRTAIGDEPKDEL